MSDSGPAVFSGRYQLLRQVAKGGMADVYLARDVALDRQVALKVLFSEFADDPNFVERFRREAKAAANLNHPNIVGIYDWGQEHGTYYIVMEYVEGRSIANVLRSTGPLHPDRAAEIAADAAGALAAAHTAGLVHRDVKLGNVMVSDEGQVKVADFGIATALARRDSDALTQIGSVMGTATYFSPEQAQGKQLDERSDLYSLGVTLYEMIVGRPPFTADTPTAVAVKHVRERPLPPRQAGVNIAETLEAIILKLLAKNPANRYPKATDLQADLNRYLAGEHSLPRPATTGTPAAHGVPGTQQTNPGAVHPADHPAARSGGGRTPGVPSATNRRGGSTGPYPSRHSGQPPASPRRPVPQQPAQRTYQTQPGSGQPRQRIHHEPARPGPRQPDTGQPLYADQHAPGQPPYPGPLQHGAGHPPHPGQPGTGQPGTGQPGAGHPGHPGTGQPPQPGHPGAGHPGQPGHPGAGHPGQPGTGQHGQTAYYYEEVPRSDTWKRNALMLVGLAALLTVLGYLVVTFYDQLELGNNDVASDSDVEDETLVELPDLNGLRIVEAESRLRELGLGVELDYRVNTTVEENTVFTQVPPPGQRMEAGGVVTLTISQGEIPTVPPVNGRYRVDARNILESSGYIVIENSETNQAEAGIVVRQDPTSGSELQLGEAVTITVSTGPGQIFVPDVQNKTTIEAFRILSGQGFRVDEEHEASETISIGMVIETRPPAGMPVDFQSEIIVVVSTGLPKVAVPDVQGLLFDTGKLTLEREGLDVGTVTFESVESGSPDIGRILSQTPLPNFETERGTLVDVVVGGPESGTDNSGTTTTTVPTTEEPIEEEAPEDG